ncbi:ABC transporter substrate-binding protein, partial [Rhizobiaceae bacterium]|nr:ABC transporter substrate-binding protein [Rhizobiaceae bacterium]
MTLRTIAASLAGAAFAALLTTSALAADKPAATDWPAIVAKAKGQTVYFNAWGGAPNINDYIAWARAEMKSRYDVNVVHVELEDTASAVAQVLAEKTAGTDTGGKVDLIWINGENFAAMKSGGLLESPGWADKLPNWQYVDVENKPTITVDFTIPTDGMESPWGGAKLVFFHDTARSDPADMPDSVAALADWTAEHPGRFSYPAPPDFIGSSFLKQALSETIESPAKLLEPVDEATFEADTAPLFELLDRMHPNMWRGGRAYPK